MPTGSRSDPLVGYHFHVEIDGVSQAQFRECSGLDSENEIVEYKEAGAGGQTVIRKQPGARIQVADHRPQDGARQEAGQQRDRVHV